jgi:hypothetical protein
MAKCAHCRQRKAKRRCPALRDGLCPECCGRYRERTIPCPPACRFLTEHRPYQEEKVRRQRSERTAPPEPAFADERLAWLGLNIEAPLHEIGNNRPEWTDGDAILALSYAREKLDRGSSLLILPGDDRRPANPAGEGVLESLDACRFEKSVLLASGREGYSVQDKLAALDVVLHAARTIARGNLKGRAYLEHVRQTFARLRDAARPAKLVTP